jgi:hypothetical protein
MTVGAIAAGLCLVVGMVTLVVALGGSAGGRQQAAGHSPPGQAGPGMRSSGSQRAHPGSQAAHRRARISPRSYRRGTMLRTYRGSGTGEPGLFQIPSPGVWGLSWQYECPGGQRGSFLLGETRSSAAMAITVQRKARSGHGTYWVVGDTGPHSLVIESRCAWRLHVFLPAGSS